MAHEADLPDADEEPPRLDRVLRLLEAVMFCCLSTLVLFWIADRMRGLDFEPIAVTPCEGEACTDYVGPYGGTPWAVFSSALDAPGVTSFSGTNLCAQLAETLETRGPEAEGVDLIVDLITSRGTMTVLPAEDGPWVLGPGARNDGYWDIVRDALSVRSSRGCYPINYKPVFWPLWSGWMLLVSLRLFRGRQREWAKR